MTDRFHDDVGAYVLGALEPGEIRRFERHLKRCRECRADVARLSAARDAIPAAVEQYDPPPTLKLSLMETVRAEAASGATRAPAHAPRRSGWRDLLLSRPRYAAVAAALVIAIGVVAGAIVGATGGGEGSDSRTVAAAVDVARMPAGKGSLVIPSDGGAILRVEGMQPPQSGRVYEVWIQRGKQITPSSLFTVDHEGHGAAAIPDDLEGADRVMVTREPEGGSSKPSERPVLSVPLRS